MNNGRATADIPPEPGWSSLDWLAPWLQPYRALGLQVSALERQGLAMPDLLNRLGDCGRRFVPQSALPPGEAYERFIARTGCIPTRENMHDGLNGLVWQRFARSKARLNALQAQAIEQAGGVGARRGPLRDALTLFDENGAVLLAPDALWQALQQRQWQRLFVELRPLWQQAQLIVIGHALLEKLITPRKPITAHVFCPAQPWPIVDNIDEVIADALDAAHLADKPFTPLPVLGIPGWCQGNQHVSFYDDPDVFRSARRPQPS